MGPLDERSLQWRVFLLILGMRGRDAGVCGPQWICIASEITDSNISIFNITDKKPNMETDVILVSSKNHTVGLSFFPISRIFLIPEKSLTFIITLHMIEFIFEKYK